MQIVVTLQIDGRAQEWSAEWRASVKEVAIIIHELCAQMQAAYPMADDDVDNVAPLPAPAPPVSAPPVPTPPVFIDEISLGKD